MKKGILAFSLAVATVFAVTSDSMATGEGWTDHFEKAKAQAAAEGKDILIDFTGSDWCGWCIKLDNEVFKQDAFKASAPKDFVLVALDYPRDKSLVTEEVAKQNEQLKTEYAISGYPTLYLTDATGRPYARAGYKAGGPEVYLPYLAELKAKGEARDKSLAAAKAETDSVAKARLIDAALEALGMALAGQFYTDEIQQIIALDAENKAGLKIKYQTMDLDKKIAGLLQQGKPDEAAQLLGESLGTLNLPETDAAKLKEEYEKKIFNGTITSLTRQKKYDDVVAYLEKRIEIKKPEGQELIDLQLIIARTYAVKKDTEKSLAMVDDIIERNDLKGVALQDALLIKYNAYWHSFDKPNQTRIMEEIVAADPDSERSRAIRKGLDAEKAKAQEQSQE